MNYEKKYKEALERMKSWAKGEHPECFSEAQKAAEFIFPELKESNDERIRKTIYGWIYTQPTRFFDNGFSKEEMLAWVEKQNKQSSSNIPSRETILAVWELGNDWKELTNGSISTKYGTQLEYIQNHWQESSYYDNIMEGGGR